ncbi:MAG: twin-arginine translocase subunit TatC [Proteobacteria bacterium]|nr:twin-arginine translocase subunit TatC [Candidatus Enterousia scatequi]
MKKMTLMQHFAELRRRFLWTLLILLVAFVAGWYLAPYLQNLLIIPLLRVWPDGALIYTGITDGLMINLSLAFTIALCVTIPVGLWHLWAYIEPGLKKKEKNFVWPVILMSPVLFFIGALFAFYVLFPFVFGFFIELNESAQIPTVLLPVARDYFVFAVNLMKVFGFAFQLPLVMVVLNRVGILSKQSVIKSRRYAIIGIVTIAAILTPPDIVSQMLLALPLLGLFEISLLFMRD